VSNSVVSLSEIVSELENGSRPEGGVDDSGDVFSVGGEHLNDFGEFDFSSVKLISHDFYQQMKRGKVKLNDIIIVKDGATTGKTSFVTDKFPHFPCAINEHVFRLSVKQTVADPRYVFYYLYSPKGNREILDDFRGATVGGISQNFVNKVFIPVPSLPEQRRIADLLSRADRLRRLRRFGDSLSASLLQSVFLEMFGDPAKNSKKWKVEKLADVGTLDRGRSKNRPRNATELYGGKYPFIQTGDIANANGYIRSYQQTYSELGLKQSKLWKSGTLCITIAANIGKTAIMTFDACFPDSVVGFIPNEQTNVEYVQYWLSFLQKELEETAPESAQKNINLEILRDLNIPVPPLPEQEQFAAVVRRVESLRGRAGESARQGEGLFQSMLARTFGEER
jgi:type I restriction enzyme S subunit